MSTGRPVAVAIALAVLVGAGFAWWHLRGPAQAPPAAREVKPADPAAPSSAPPAAQAPADSPPPVVEPEPLGLAGVDLEEVRAALPGNLYWEMAAPTDDPALLEARELAKEQRNLLYGKILSGTATDPEILDYYDYRMRASTDYVAFVDYLLEHHVGELTDQDHGLLLVARKLHLARLEEIPRRIQEARERKARQDEARRAWLEDQRAFEAGLEAEAAEAAP